MKGNKVILIVVGIVLLAIGWFVIKYNGFVQKEEAMESSWAQIDNQLQRRFDLIPNLIEATKGYMAHEEQIFTHLADARAKYGDAATVEEQAAASDELTSALGRLLVIVESYPDLKANQQFTQLMDELAGTENRLAVARQDYNNAVQSFNSEIRTFPSSMIAGMFGFERKSYFEVDGDTSQVPTVDFGGE
ncbi:LemA family protein [Lysinibacillus louembei]|uniref:LemA family protein n=1 Tax=Lysinibacillus louembei TaxID=1470088 RepID=A0ABZ0S023_9BACI|nr:LemA family protein [Lysinibacillus louembei]WPK12896.1 LemA family protein [Lysinibacillus louembei]